MKITSGHAEFRIERSKIFISRIARDGAQWYWRCFPTSRPRVRLEGYSKTYVEAFRKAMLAAEKLQIKTLCAEGEELGTAFDRKLKKSR